MAQATPRIRPRIAELAREFTALRHDLHEHPQTGFEETYAHNVIRGKLDSWGVTYDIMAGTGMVVTIKGRAGSGPVLGFRADMDALNITETSGVAWASRTQGKMHACGHDGHIAILLSAAQHLAENRGALKGTLKLIFQPAEEGVGGAQKMISEGLLQKHSMNSLYALHNWPGLPLGIAAVHEGPVMASNTNFLITLTGKSAHGAMPEQGLNPILPAAAIAASLRSIETEVKEIWPFEKQVLSVTALQAGTRSALNVIPDEAVIGGTLRTYNEDLRLFAAQKLEEKIRVLAMTFGVAAKVDYPNQCPPTINTRREWQRATRALRAILGKENVHYPARPAMTAEDFGNYLSAGQKGCYIWLGQGDPACAQSPHNKTLHNSGYDFNDALIPIGAEYFVRLAEALSKAL